MDQRQRLPTAVKGSMKILDKILKLYYDNRKIKIVYNVMDLYDGVNATGTKVQIEIPTSP